MNSISEIYPNKIYISTIHNANSASMLEAYEFNYVLVFHENSLIKRFKNIEYKVIDIPCDTKMDISEF